MAYKGYIFGCERKRVGNGGAKGVLRRMTDARAVHHHLYFGPGTWSADGRHLLFVSYRTGFPNLFGCDWGCGEIRQITARIDFNPHSAAPSPTRREYFYTARDEVWKVQHESRDETLLARFMGAKVGNCSVDLRGDLVAVSVRRPGTNGIAVVSADGTGSDVILEKEGLAGPRFNPADPSVLLYSMDRGRRLWTVRADGTDDRQAYEATDGERAIHERWLGRTGMILFTTPTGKLRVAGQDGSVRTVLEEGAWHSAPNREGDRIVCDSTAPGTDIFIVDPGTCERETMARAKASRLGRWWREPSIDPGDDIEGATLRSGEPEMERAPGERSPETMYGPEWTHPHPVFDAEGRRIVFTAEQRGWPQVYVLEPGTK